MLCASHRHFYVSSCLLASLCIRVFWLPAALAHDTGVRRQGSQALSRSPRAVELDIAIGCDPDILGQLWWLLEIFLWSLHRQAESLRYFGQGCPCLVDAQNLEQGEHLRRTLGASTSLYDGGHAGRWPLYVSEGSFWHSGNLGAARLGNPGQTSKSFRQQRRHLRLAAPKSSQDRSSHAKPHLAARREREFDSLFDADIRNVDAVG